MNNKNTNKFPFVFGFLFILISFVALAAIPSPAFAADAKTSVGSDLNSQTGVGPGTCGGSGSGIPNPLGNTCNLYDFFNKVLKVVQQIMAVVIVMAIIYTGFLFVKAQGNSEELETAKRAFLWTVIGAAVLLGSTVLSKIIQATIDQLSKGL